MERKFRAGTFTVKHSDDSEKKPWLQRRCWSYRSFGSSRKKRLDADYNMYLFNDICFTCFDFFCTYETDFGHLQV